MYFDWTYIVFLLPALLFSTWASARVRNVFNKYGNHRSLRGLTGEQAARSLLDANGLYDVRIEQCAGQLSDHYDPGAKVIRLSEGVYGSSSEVAIGIACHETGHAIQHAQGYAPLRLRSAIIPITNLGAKLSGPLILAGFLLASFSESLLSLAYIGILCFSLSTLFQFITLPVEFNASRRALEAIEERGILYDTELGPVREILSAAALTYVAALAVSLVQLLRFIMLVNRRRE